MKERTETAGKKPIAIGIQSQVTVIYTRNLILMAGHTKNFRKIDENRKIAKKTNGKEYEIYANPGGLRDIIPATETTTQDSEEIRDMGENIIVMQNMFYGIKEQSLVAFDVKIGKSTTSRSQLVESMEEGRFGAFFRELKMKLYDRYTKSSIRGWRAIPVDERNRATIGRNSEAFLQSQLDRISAGKYFVLKSIITQLNLIRETLEKNQKTFIASSVLIVIDLQHTENVGVKLIDLAHPVEVNNRHYKKHKRNFDDGINSLITFLRLLMCKR